VEREKTFAGLDFTREKTSQTQAHPRLILLGGFLGAGKTTLIGGVSRMLQERGLRVGLITNDQGQGLLDTASARLHANDDADVKEISGGCFCCRLEELVGALEALQSDQRPDVILAEPVGSCTDLMATVILPLQTIYRAPLTITPLSVTLDARRALAALGGKRNARDFHRDVGYVYRKQMEEAEWLIVNKWDLLVEEDRSDLTERLQKSSPQKRIFHCSAKTEEGLEELITALLSAESAPQQVMEVDYQRYAEGEAMLGWLNSQALCTAVAADQAMPELGAWLLALGESIAQRLDAAGYEVGHFKMSLTHLDRRYRVHQVISGEALLIEQDQISAKEEASEACELLINLRAEGAAEAMQQIVDDAIAAQSSLRVEFCEQAAFQPGKPQPTHRVSALA